jgi:hypothetical protein
MSYDHTNFQNIDPRSSKNDRSDVDSASNHVVEVINPTLPRIWAWAHHSDSYDWMDWHCPFPAIGPDGMDTVLPSGTQGPAGTRRPSRTERHQCARVEFRHVHLRNGGPK